MPDLAGLIARPDGTTAPGRISFGERIESVRSAAAAGGDHILPAFIDLQVNGSNGIDVMTASPDALLTLAAHLAREGVSAFLPTAVTAPVDAIENVDRAIGAAMQRQSHEAGGSASAVILGMHLEGPFISGKRLGAHSQLNLSP